MPNTSGWLTVAEAAERLAVHPQRIYPLVRSGSLRAFKHGGRWEVDPAGVDRLRHQDRPSGRPFTPANAWALIALAAPGQLPAPALPTKSLSRLRGELRAARGRLDRLAPRLRSRAKILRLRAHPGDLRRVAQDVVLGGAAAARHAPEADEQLLEDGLVEGYLREGRVAKLARSYLLSEAPDENVVLHAVPDHVWPFPSGTGSAPPVVAALDLLDSGDQRAERVGHQILRRLATRLEK